MSLYGAPMKMVLECSGDVQLQQVVCVSLHSGVLLASVCSGLLLGMITAVLIHALIIKPRCLSAKSTVHDPWSFVDIDETQEEPERDFVGINTEPADTHHVSMSPSDPPVLSDVSAFALKARVVYPINQRYRPLADGASNPSPHDSASSSSEWPSRDGEDDESSETVSSCCSNKTHPNLTFRRAPHYAYTLCYPDHESRLSAHCVTLQDLHQHVAQLQQDRWTIFIQILRVLFSAEDQLIQQQEKEVEEVKKGMTSELLESYEGAEPHSNTCTVEELERAGRERLEQTLHRVLCFATHLERFSKILQSSRPNEVTQEMMGTFFHCLLLVEKQLKVIQANIIQTLYDRQQWWEELSGWLHIKTTLLRQKAELIVKLTSQSVEELTADGELEFDHMEKLISDLQSGISDELQRCTHQLTQHTLQLIGDHCMKMGVRKRKMMKTQNKEKSHMNKSHNQQDAQQFTMVWVELQMKHWTQIRDFELQQDRRLSESVCDLWKNQFSDFSRRLTLLWRECVMSALNTSSTLSEEHCQTLLNNVQLTLTNQKEQAESHTHQQLDMLRDKLCREKQVWGEQEALAIAALNYLGNQHLKVTMATVTRQQDLHDSDPVIKAKQRHLVTDLKRCLTAQHFYNTILSAMKITQHTEPHTQSLQQDLLSDLEAAAELLRGHGQFLIGHALVHRAHKRLATSVPSDMTAADDGQKERWVKTVCESTCVSRESLETLIKNYYSQIQTVVTSTQLRPPQHTRFRERQRARADCMSALQRELSHWARKPNSAEFYRRVEQQKRRFVAHFEEECVSDMVDVQHLTHTIREELRKEEENFLSRLAALTRVSVKHTNATRLKQ